MTNLDDIFSNAKGAVKAAIFFLLLGALIPAALLFKRMDPAHPFRILRIFHRCLLRLLGIRVRVRGKPSSASPVLFVSNHVSYLDIPAIGAVLPAAFVAKAEVSDWPLFGFLARVQNTVFVERRVTRAAVQREQLRDSLAHGRNLILFPEGTSSVGLSVLPFKSSLFSIVEDLLGDKEIVVQPLSVTCVESGGLPMLLEDRSRYAWYGDMTLAPHLWEIFKGDGFTVELAFHDPLTTADYPSRKDLAAACHKAVFEGVRKALGSGRYSNSL